MKSKISSAARGWLGTPFHRQGRIKGIGCDCLGLLMGVANELNLTTLNGKPITELDCTEYELIVDGSVLEEQLDRNLAQTSTFEEGDLLLMEYDSNPQHLGIVTLNNSNFYIIHAHIKQRKVVEHILDVQMRSRIKKIYSLINR